MSTQNLRDRLVGWENPSNPFQLEPDLNSYAIIKKHGYRFKELKHLYGIVYAIKTDAGNYWITSDTTKKDQILSAPKSFIAASPCKPKTGLRLPIERWHYMFGLQRVLTSPIVSVSRVLDDLYKCTTSSGSTYFVFV